VCFRSYSPMETIGGGVVLVPNARKHKRYKDQIIDELQNIEHKGKTFQVEKAIYESGVAWTLDELAKKFGVEYTTGLVHMCTTNSAMRSLKRK